MKPILYILISLLLFSCSEKLETVEFVPEKFQIDTVTIELNYTPRDIIQFKDGFLCRISPYNDDSLQLIYLDNKFQVNYVITKELNFGLGNYANAIWTSSDTLFTICGLRNYDLRYRTNKNWVVLDTGSTNKQNYMHHEKNLPIYEDSEFRVNSCCRGEFGGAVFFYDKKSKKTYSCPATCLSGIQKFNNSFYISSSLYSASVIKIDNPRNLYEIKNELQLMDCSWYDIYSDKPNDVEIKHPKDYDKGFESVLDTFDISILGSFELKNHLYWVYSDTKSAYVGYINDKRLQPIDTIYKKRMYLNEVRDLKHNSNILPIRSREMKGLIILEGNKIRIVEFKSNTTNSH
jgi:hypothetical protein